MPDNSAAVALTSISARRGCPSAEKTTTFPSPAAETCPGIAKNAKLDATAATDTRKPKGLVNPQELFFTAHPELLLLEILN